MACNYNILLYKSNVKFRLLRVIVVAKIENNNEKAFSILKIEATKILEKMGMSNQAIQDKIVAMWALVQGLTTIMITNDIKYSESWEEKIEEIIKSVCIAK